jgi:uncharacterized protein GlcG (DUF336 family)
MKTAIICGLGVIACAATSKEAVAAPCDQLPNAAAVSGVLSGAVSANNGGLGNNMWATVVDQFGTVCLVVRTAERSNAIWLGSRVISAQKANTGNSFSLPKGARGTDIALSSANLYSAVQPGGSLFGLQESNPVDPTVAYAGAPASFGTGAGDPMVGKRIGGINVFGGGLALYDSGGRRVGGLGVSGDTSCTDHFVAWRVRHRLKLDYVPGGVSPENDDNIIYDLNSTGASAGGFGHPTCLNNPGFPYKNLPDVQRPK